MLNIAVEQRAVTAVNAVGGVLAGSAYLAWHDSPPCDVVEHAKFNKLQRELRFHAFGVLAPDG